MSTHLNIQILVYINIINLNIINKHQNIFNQLHEMFD